METQRPYLQSPWRTDHARLLHSLSLFVYSVYREQPQGLSLLHTGEQVTKFLSSPAAEFHPEAQAGTQHAGQKHTVVTVTTTSCSQGWLPVLCGSSPSLSSSGAEAEGRRKSEKLSLLICLSILDPSSTPCFIWSGTEGIKPTRMKVTWHWSQAKVRPCTLALQLSYWSLESQASLVSRNALQ